MGCPPTLDVALEMVVVGRRTPSSTGMDGAVWMEDNQARVDQGLGLVAGTVMMMGDVMSRRMSTLWSCDLIGC
jgi:hypothetical protein